MLFLLLCVLSALFIIPSVIYVILNVSEGSVSVPAPGGFTDLYAFGRELRWWRMPSTSRAYPLPLAAKASAYAQLWPQPLDL